MITYKKQVEIPLAKGFDVVVDFFDDGEVCSRKTFHFVSQRELKNDYEPRMIKAVANIEAQIADDQIKKEWSREEIEDLLKEKGYLEENQDIEDLPQKVDEVAK